VPIYNALDPTTHFPVRPDPAFAADLSFLGNRLPDREARVQDFFVGAAGSLPECSFLLGGNGWEVSTMPANVRYAGHISTNDHNAFNSSAHAVLNISRDCMARYGFSPATRVFEAAGAGACVITDAWEGIEMFFEPEREILVANSGEEVAARLRSLTESAARSIGQAARKRALADHTYANRAIQVDSILNGRFMAAGRQM
jgi:spore maturation protein CgeB